MWVNGGKFYVKAGAQGVDQTVFVKFETIGADYGGGVETVPTKGLEGYSWTE